MKTLYLPKSCFIWPISWFKLIIWFCEQQTFEDFQVTLFLKHQWFSLRLVKTSLKLPIDHRMFHKPRKGKQISPNWNEFCSHLETRSMQAWSWVGNMVHRAEWFLAHLVKGNFYRMFLVGRSIRALGLLFWTRPRLTPMIRVLHKHHNSASTNI